MTDDQIIRERPDRTTTTQEVWQREGEDGAFKVFMENGELVYACHGIACGRNMPHFVKVSELPKGRYRIRTLDPMPWPEQKRIEKRRLVLLSDKTWKAIPSKYEVTPLCYGALVLDEIRDCEIDADGRVVTVIPFQTES